MLVFSCFEQLLFVIQAAIYHLISVQYIMSLWTRTGDGFYQFVEGFSFVVVMILIYLIMIPLKYTHNSHHVVFRFSLYG